MGRLCTFMGAAGATGIRDSVTGALSAAQSSARRLRFPSRRGRAGSRDDAENNEKQGSAEERVAEGLIVWTGLIHKGAGEVKGPKHRRRAGRGRAPGIRGKTASRATPRVLHSFVADQARDHGPT